MGINSIAKQMVEQYQVEKMTEKTSQQYALFMNHLNNSSDFTEDYKNTLLKIAKNKVMHDTDFSSFHQSKKHNLNYTDDDVNEILTLFDKLIINRYLSKNDSIEMKLSGDEIEQLSLFQDQDVENSTSEKMYRIVIKEDKMEEPKSS